MTIDPRDPRTGLPRPGSSASDITRPLGRPYGADSSRPTETGAFSASVPQAGLPNPSYSARLPEMPSPTARQTNAGRARVFYPSPSSPAAAATSPGSSATAQSKLDGVRARIAETADSVLRTPRKTVSAHPMAALGIGVGVGLGAGLLLGRLLSR